MLSDILRQKIRVGSSQERKNPNQNSAEDMVANSAAINQRNQAYFPQYSQDIQKQNLMTIKHEPRNMFQ